MNRFQMQYNDFDFSDWLIVESVRRPFLPNVDFYTEKVIGQRGRYFFKREDTESVVEVDIRIISQSRQSLKESSREIAKKLYSEEPEILIVRDNPEVMTYSILDSTSLEKLRSTGSTTLSFICFDPTVYSVEQYDYTLSSGITTVPYSGGHEARSIFELKPVVSEYIEIRLVNTGKFIRVEYPFIGGEEVVIDIKKENVLINGVSLLKHVTYDSDFFFLNKGENRIELINATGLIKYREEGFDA